MSKGGAKIWYFPDGYLPAKSAVGAMEAHEALMLMNIGAVDANVTIDIYFSDRAPIKNINVIVPAERVIALRLDKPAEIGGAEVRGGSAVGAPVAAVAPASGKRTVKVAPPAGEDGSAPGALGVVGEAGPAGEDGAAPGVDATPAGAAGPAPPEETDTSPPCASAMAATMASPRPAPPVRRAREMSAR